MIISTSFKLKTAGSRKCKLTVVGKCNVETLFVFVFEINRQSNGDVLQINEFHSNWKGKENKVGRYK